MIRHRLARAIPWLRGPKEGPPGSGESEGEQPEAVELPGPWCQGLALAMHSQLQSGAETAPTVVGELLDRFKYAGERGLCGGLARRMAQAIASECRRPRIEAVVHVPSSRPGMGAARELAKAVARRLRVACLPDLIARVRRIEPQKDLSTLAQKRQNVHGAFRVRRPDLIARRTVLLVDDVYDSGATLEEAWRVLTEAGARDVTVATVTKTRFRRDGRD
jgi:predicted amidophosphoribosyltransferase